MVGLESAALQRRGHEVRTVVVSNSDVSGVFGWFQVAIGMFWSARGKNIIREATLEFGPDIMHVHNWFPLLSPSVFSAARSLGVPTVWTLHNYRIVCPSGILFMRGEVTEDALHHGPWRIIFRRPYRNSLPASILLAALIYFHKCRNTWFEDVDRFIALTEFQRETLVAAGAVPKMKVAVKGNFLQSAAHESAGYEAESRDYALFIGRDSSEKGLDLLLDAWGGEFLPLKVVGAEERSDSGVQSNVDFLGRVSPDEVNRILNGARFVIIPSRCYECFPLVLLEAWRAGVPVVVPKHGAFSGLVTDRVTGFFFNPGDTVDLNRVLQEIQRDLEGLDNCSVGGKEVFREEFSEAVNIAQLEGVYRALIT